MKIKYVLITASILLVLLGVLYFAGQKQSEKGLSAVGGKKLENPGQINLLFISFRIKYNRWPVNMDELERFIKENNGKGDYDLTPYQNLTFTETAKKSLKIHYDGYKKGDISGGPYDAELNISP